MVIILGCRPRDRGSIPLSTANLRLVQQLFACIVGAGSIGSIPVLSAIWRDSVTIARRIALSLVLYRGVG